MHLDLYSDKGVESFSGYGGESKSEIRRFLLFNIRDCYLKSKEINYNMLFILTNAFC
jgi:hypothetical protein